MWLRVYNGAWSSWQLTQLTDQGPPVVTPMNQGVPYSQSVPLSPNIFWVSSGNVTQYQVWFSYPQLGYPALGTVTNNGTALAQNQAVQVSSLSGLEYTARATAG